MRQLFDMKEGARRGPWSEMMKPVLDKMSVQDMMNVSAYAASLAPAATGARGTR
jgi:cytochrome c553